MKSIEEKVKDYWLTDGVDVNPGASNKTLEKFESKYDVKLPTDLRMYFSCVNGMTEGQTDKDLIRLWAVEELLPLSDYYGDSSYMPDAGSLFIFADWSIEAHLYTIRLEESSSEANRVYVMGQHQQRMQEVSQSFSEFAGGY